MRRGLALVLALAVSVTGLPPAAAAEKIGVVLLHGKNSTNKARAPVGGLKTALEEAGFATVTPELPWSRDRQYAVSVDDALREIGQAVAAMKGQGIAKVVLAGHSLGANVALAYAAQRPGLAGLVVIAPGHVPESDLWRKLFADDVAKAKAMVAAGKGGERADFTDRNQGKSSTVTTSAAAYLSYFDHDGMAEMSNTAPRLKPDLPVLWIVEEAARDPGAGRVPFDKIPDGVRKEYATVDASHLDAPQKSAGLIVQWLNKR